MNIYSLIEKNNQKNLEKIACTLMEDDGTKRSYTYYTLFESVSLFATSLKDAGILKGDRIVLVAENCPEWNIAYLAILKLEATAVLVDASLSGDEINRLIAHSDSRAIYTSPSLLKTIVPFLGTEIPVLNIMDHSHSFEGYPSIVPKMMAPTIDPDKSIATIIFSSGTTRSAMGIMHTHDALVKSTLMCTTSNQLDKDGRYLSVIPNSHVYGLVCLVLAPMLLGANSLSIESMNAPAIKAAFDDYHPTIFPCVPKVFDLFKNQAIMTINSKKITKLMFKLFFPLCLTLRNKFGINLGQKLFKSIHQAFGGEIDILCSAGAPMSQETANFYLGTGFNLLITYGATETNIPTIGNRRKNLTADTCGQPYEDVEVKLTPSGEILIKSPYMMKGYFRDPEATAEAFEGEWLKTGDIGALDSSGNYRIIGRSKENIVLGSGKKLTPEDVELVYSDLNGVLEFVVAGVPTVNSYDEVHAFIVKDQLNLTNEAILQELNEKTATASSHLKIAKVHFVEEIPKTSLQKPKRYLLKQAALSEQLPTETPTIATKNHTTDNLEETVIQLIADLGEIDTQLITSHAKPFSELGMDSIAAINLAMSIEDRYNVKCERIFTPEMTVTELVTFILDPELHRKEAKADKLDSTPKVKKKIDYILFKTACILARFLYKVTVKNEQKIPNDSGYIICANHVSNLDYLWLTINFKKEQFQNFYCMAKEEVVNKAAISQLLTRICGMIPVNRNQASSEALSHCKGTLAENKGLLIHPEGTRSQSGQLGTFKTGAAVLAIDSGVPIIPAFIHGAYDIYPRSQKLPKWFNFTKMRKYPVEVIYGTPIMPTGLTAKELTLKVEEAMRALAVPVL